jgi:adenylate cyclase
MTTRTREKLAVNILGPLRIAVDGGTACPVPGQKLQALLAYLATHAGHPIAREKLATLLWSNRFDDQARQSLRTSLSRLRTVLGDAAERHLQADRENVTLNASGLEVDALTFERLVDEGTPESNARATDLYIGDILDGATTKEEPFDEWLNTERSRLRELACNALAQLIAHQEANSDFESALKSARRLIALDSVREDAHRSIMRAHAQAGRQSAALKQFQNCTDNVREALGVEPEAETQRLASEIRSSDAFSATALDAKAEPVAHNRRLKIAVLPFAGLSGDSEQDYFVNGINEDIATALTRNRWLSVMGHNTTMVLKGQRDHMLAAAREFGARYVVEGSVRKAGSRMRITAQLIDTDSSERVWAERYDRDLEDIFAVQDEITNTITATIEPELAASEARRIRETATDKLDAWDCYHLGLSHMYKFTKADNAKAQALFQDAVRIDSDYAIAYARLSYAKVMSVVYFEAEATPALLDEALALAKRATQLDDLDAVAQFSLGRAHLIRGDYDDSVAAFETALSLNPCLAHTHCGLGDTLAYRGNPGDSLDYFDEAVHLSPHDPYRWAFLMYGSMAYLFLERHEDAAQWANAASRVPNAHYWATAALVSALGHLGRKSETRAARTSLLAQNPNFTCRFARERLFYIRDPHQIDHYINGLKLAGIPE